MRVVELYCGIGGVAAALGPALARDTAQIVAAVDVNTVALGVYGHNFPGHETFCRSVESVEPKRAAAWDADLWWASPPCQPFTRRGLSKGLDDARARTFVALMDLVAAVRPPSFAMENVVGFETSAARDLLLRTLEGAGYSELREHLVCPQELGRPNRRPRYYAVASRNSLGPGPSLEPDRRSLDEALEPFEPSPDAIDSLRLTPEHLRRYDGALHIVERHDPDAVTGCFTSAYGRSHVRSGSFLRHGTGARRFSPREILSLLDFPASYQLPADLSAKSAWRLVGNSLALEPVRRALGQIPGLEV